jgi:hypothetical protein
MPSVASREQKIYGGGGCPVLSASYLPCSPAGNRCLLIAYCPLPTAYSHPKEAPWNRSIDAISSRQ